MQNESAGRICIYVSSSERGSTARSTAVLRAWIHFRHEDSRLFDERFLMSSSHPREDANLRSVCNLYICFHQLMYYLIMMYHFSSSLTPHLQGIFIRSPALSGWYFLESSILKRQGKYPQLTVGLADRVHVS